MNTKLLAVTLFASAALVAQAYGGSHHGGGAVSSGFSGGGSAPRGGSYYHAMPSRAFSGRMMYAGPRYSSYGMRSTTSYRPYTYSARVAPRSINSANHFTGSGTTSRLAPNGSRTLARNGAIQGSRNATNRVRSGGNLRPNWRNHVVAQHSASWHRDWDRGRDHFFHGHRFVFIDGFWCGFDLGFDPWWPGWYYPYDYYGYGYPYGYSGYPYGYDGDPPGYDSNYDNDQGDEQNYEQQGSDSRQQQGYQSDRYVESSVAGAQDRLQQQGYYHGRIDGVLGPATSRAVARYQSDHGLRVTGRLTSDTLRALGLGEVARY